MLECLENRWSPAVLTVNSSADNTSDDAVLTLREGILLVNKAGNAIAALGRPLSAGEAAQLTGPFGAGDTIAFDAITFSTPQTISLGGTALAITEDLLVDGPGAGLLTIDGNNASEVLHVSDPPAPYVTNRVTVRGLTITGGDIAGSNSAFIRNSEDLTLDSVVVSGSSASDLIPLVIELLAAELIGKRINELGWGSWCDHIVDQCFDLVPQLVDLILGAVVIRWSVVGSNGRGASKMFSPSSAMANLLGESSREGSHPRGRDPIRLEVRSYSSSTVKKSSS